MGFGVINLVTDLGRGLLGLDSRDLTLLFPLPGFIRLLDESLCFAPPDIILGDLSL